MNTKYNPDKWAFFGGLNEGGETPVECFIRELNEEVGVCFTPEQVIPLREYPNEELNTYRMVFFVESDIPIEKLTLGEGAGFGWIPLDEVINYELTEKTLDDITYFIDMK